MLGTISGKALCWSFGCTLESPNSSRPLPLRILDEIRETEPSALHSKQTINCILNLDCLFYNLEIVVRTWSDVLKIRVVHTYPGLLLS